MLRSDYKDKERKKYSKFYGEIRLKILVVIAILVVSLVSSQLVFANNLAVDGQKLSEIDDKIKNLDAQNTTLKIEIAKISSLTQLSQKAEVLGFVKPQRVNNQ